MPYDGRFLTQVQKDLLDAAKIIRERGLAKYTRKDTLGRVCVRGALALVTTGDAWSYKPREIAAGRKLSVLVEGRFSRIPGSCGLPEVQYNNLPSTTAEDMAKLCEEAAFD